MDIIHCEKNAMVNKSAQNNDSIYYGQTESIPNAKQ